MSAGYHVTQACQGVNTNSSGANKRPAEAPRRLVRYRLADVEEYERGLIRRSTSDSGVTQ